MIGVLLIANSLAAISGAAASDGPVTLAQAMPGQPQYHTAPAYQDNQNPNASTSYRPVDPRRRTVEAPSQTDDAGASEPQAQPHAQPQPQPQQDQGQSARAEPPAPAPAPAPVARQSAAQPAPAPQQQAAAQNNVGDYVLGVGDRLQVLVFGEEDLSGEFEIDGNGRIFLPLVGAVQLGGQTIQGAQLKIIDLLEPDYLKGPKVSLAVTNYRDFYILGEVNEPGNFPYKSGLTVINAVALAGGYTGRASKNNITVVRATDPDRKETRIDVENIIQPGDILRVKQRLF